MSKKNNNSDNRAKGSSISFTPDQLESIDDLAKAMHMTRSALVLAAYKAGVPIFFGLLFVGAAMARRLICESCGNKTTKEAKICAVCGSRFE